MTDDANDTLADSPKDPVTGEVRPHPGPSERPGTEAEAASGKAPPRPGDGASPAGQRNTAHRGNETASEGPDHETEEAAAYRENDA